MVGEKFVELFVTEEAGVHVMHVIQSSKKQFEGSVADVLQTFTKKCQAVNRLGCHEELRCQMSCQKCSTTSCELMRHGCANTRPTSPSPN